MALPEVPFLPSPEHLPGGNIKVVGVGGAGCNAINRMLQSGVTGVQFIAMNTDRQSLAQSKAHVQMPLGPTSSRGGLGAGGNPDRGAVAAEESREEILAALSGADMVFITAGMGGGTGTGAAPLIAAYAREQGALTVSVVLTPFAWEGPRKAEKALGGLANLRDTSDTVIVVSNEKLMSVCERGTKMTDAYQMADGVLIQGVRGIADLILRPGLVNLDFADVESVLKDGGEAFIGTGMGRGEEAVMDALLKALASPLLDRAADGFATNVIVSVMAHPDQVGFSEFSTAMNYLHERFEGHAEIKPGQVLAPEMEDRVIVTVLASGFESATSSTSLSLYQRTVAPAMDTAPHNTPSGRVYGEVPPEANPAFSSSHLPPSTPTRLMPQMAQGPTPSGEMADQAEDLHVPAIIRLSQGRLPIE